MATTHDERTAGHVALFRDILEAMRGHEMTSVRLVLAMAFVESVKRSKKPNLPEALDTFTHEATEFYYKGPPING